LGGGSGIDCLDARSQHHNLEWQAVEVSQLRQTTYELGRDMELPSYYGYIHEKIRSNLDRMGLGTRIGTLPQGTIQESPHAITADRAQKASFKARASSLLKQGRTFVNMGLEAEDEIKPLLLHYGIAQTWGFFVQSCIAYPGRSTSWAVSDARRSDIPSQGIGERFVRASDQLICSFRGKVPVLQDMLGFLSVETSIIVYPTAYPIDLKVEDWYRIFTDHWKEDNSLRGEIVVDQDCYMLLFVASHLARYRPETWTEIVRGESSQPWMRLYRRAFERCRFMFEKVVLAVHYVSEGVSPRDALYYPAWSYENGPQPVPQDNTL